MPSEMVLYFFSNLYCVNCVLVEEEKLSKLCRSGLCKTLETGE
jgi:hypothetical protein